MAASSSLSVEIWQTILRYAIAVTTFLDTDLAEDVLVETLYTNPLTPEHDENAYWKAEKTRNCLQLVSKSWDEYLRRFEHRYVRMSDIRHGRVEPNKLRNAKRIAFNICSLTCSKCSDLDDEFKEFCQDTLSEVDSLDAQIVDMKPEIGSFLLAESHASKFAHVSTLYALECPHSFRLIRLIDVLPNLRRVHNNGLPGRQPPNTFVHLTAQNLHTLDLRIPMNGRDYHDFTLELPSLRNLAIRFDTFANVPSFVLGTILHVLRAVGGQLRSLHLIEQAEPHWTMREVWHLCPKLEILFTRFPLYPSPPHFHPIHTLIVWEESQLKGLEPLPAWPNLRRVIMALDEGFSAFEDWGALSIASRAGLRVEDKHGLTLEDYKETKFI